MSFWVIEAMGPTGPRYWASFSTPNEVGRSSAFTDKLHEAVQFSRIGDAQRVQYTIVHPEIRDLCRATEHGEKATVTT